MPAIIAMLADDILGSSREATSPESLPRYLDAFHAVDTDANQFLLIVEDGARIVGTLQLTFMAGLSRGGQKRGLIEAVRVASDRRGEKIGEAIIALGSGKMPERKLRDRSADDRQVANEGSSLLRQAGPQAISYRL